MESTKFESNPCIENSLTHSNDTINSEREDS